MGGSALDLVRAALDATTAYRRPDLRSRLEDTEQRLRDPDVRVLVVGEYKQGKSELINALINAAACPVDDDVATAVPTEVSYAPDAVSVRLAHRPDTDTDDADDGGADGRRLRYTEVPVEQLAQHVAETGDPAQLDGLSHVEVRVPRRLLSGGLVLVDTPGVGGLASPHTVATMRALAGADAMILVSDASGEFTATELEFLDAARRLCPTVACALTKVDLYPRWREIAERDRAHLAAAGVDGPLFPTSAVLRRRAASTDDAALNEESGFAELVIFLRDRIVAESEALDRRSASHVVLAVTSQLARRLRTELVVAQDPGRAETLLAELRRAKDRAEALKQRSARWQLTLSDGFVDLQSDIDRDLRDRMRVISKEVDERIDAEDPAQIWEQFHDWLRERVAAAGVANVVLAGEGACVLADRVGEHFGEAVGPDLYGVETDALGRSLSTVVRPDMERFGLGQKLLAGVKGGYGGLLMVGLATSLAGLSLLNPFSAVAGVLLGGRGVREEQRRLLQRRRTDAKAAARRHVDEATALFAQDAREMLRHVQRGLRDQFTALAEASSTSTGEAVRAARTSLETATSEREQRIRDLTAELDRIAVLERRARALVGRE